MCRNKLCLLKLFSSCFLLHQREKNNRFVRRQANRIYAEGIFCLGRKNVNYKYINDWLKEKNLKLQVCFAEYLRDIAYDHKSGSTNLCDIYKMLGCSKQNVSYWKTYSFSTQSQKSILKVIKNAAELFDLTEEQTEKLANAAGLTLHTSDENLYHFISLNYIGKKKTLYDNALISERMFRYYKKMAPTKQALLAIAISLNTNMEDMNKLLRGYGYCLSDSVVADLVVMWFMENKDNKAGALLLGEINEMLDNMGLPLLMTRQ